VGRRLRQRRRAVVVAALQIKALQQQVLDAIHVTCEGPLRERLRVASVLGKARLVKRREGGTTTRASFNPCTLCISGGSLRGVFGRPCRDPLLGAHGLGESVQLGLGSLTIKLLSIDSALGRLTCVMERASLLAQRGLECRRLRPLLPVLLLHHLLEHAISPVHAAALSPRLGRAARARAAPLGLALVHSGPGGGVRLECKQRIGVGRRNVFGAHPHVVGGARPKPAKDAPRLLPHEAEGGGLLVACLRVALGQVQRAARHHVRE